jgi:hypothetical protein
MAWRELTVDLESIALTLDLVAAGTYPLWPLDPGSIDPDSLFIDVTAVMDGDDVQYKAYLLFDFTSGSADTGWQQATPAYGSVAAAMGSVNLSTLTRDTYGIRTGNSFQRRMLLVWK